MNINFDELIKDTKLLADGLHLIKLPQEKIDKEILIGMRKLAVKLNKTINDFFNDVKRRRKLK